MMRSIGFLALILVATLLVNSSEIVPQVKIRTARANDVVDSYEVTLI